MKKVLLAAILSLFVLGLGFSDAGDLSLYSSLTGSGTTMGGLRYDLGGGLCADGSVTMTGSTYSYFADLYYGSWGVAINGSNTTSLSSASLMYAVEQSISDSVLLGIAVPLVTWNDGVSDLTFVGSWDIYAVLAF